MRRRFPVVAITLCIASWCGATAAQGEWSEYRYPDQGFAVEFPGEPTVTSAPSEGERRLMDYQYQYKFDRETYFVMVMQFTDGRGPDDPDTAYLQRLVAAYAEGAKARRRTQYAAFLAGHPALEAITEDVANDRYDLLDVFTAGVRIYLIVSEGPKGHEDSAEAKRFRDSLKLLGP
jgi:hypothetical protein